MIIKTASGNISLPKRSLAAHIVRGWIDGGGWSGTATLASVERTALASLGACRQRKAAYAVGKAMAAQSLITA